MHRADLKAWTSLSRQSPPTGPQEVMQCVQTTQVPTTLHASIPYASGYIGLSGDFIESAQRVAAVVYCFTIVCQVSST